MRYVTPMVAVVLWTMAVWSAFGGDSLTQRPGQAVSVETPPGPHRSAVQAASAQTDHPPGKPAPPAKQDKTGTEKPASGEPAQKPPADKPGEKPGQKSVQEPKKALPAEAKPSGAAAAGEPAEPYLVKREPLRVELTVRGAFEARTTVELAVRPQVWQTLEVESAVEHGAAVKKGQVLVQFDRRKIDEEIGDLKLKQALGELALKQAAENLKALEASTPLDLKQAERSRQIAQEDLEEFVRADRALAERSAEFSLKQAEQTLEYEREELRQLEKMYKADDLTEETEEIVLKRQRNAVKAAEFRLELAKANYHDTMKFDLPRRAETMQQAAVRAEIAAAKSKVLLPLALDQARRELERLKIERAKEADRLKKLEVDRQALTVKAPIDGVVYYGRFTRGRWSGAETAAESLRPGSTVTKNTVFMTIVQPRPLMLRGTVSEAEFRKVRKGLAGMVEPAAFPFVKLPAVIEQVGAVPSSADSFEVRISVKLDSASPPVVPGMNGTARFVVYRQEKALVVPARAVFSDPDEAQPYVFVVPKDGKARKQPVRVGQAADDRLEILAGVREGDRVLLQRPKPEEPPAADTKKPGKKAKANGSPKPRKSKEANSNPRDQKQDKRPAGNE